MPFVTLLSDFGLKDASVAIVKGLLYQTVPNVLITDISHEVKPFEPAEAAYMLQTSFKNFPTGTIHLVLAEMFGSVRHRIILAEVGGHFFLSADNGILPLALGKTQYRLCKEFVSAVQFSDWVREAGTIIAAISEHPESAITQFPAIEPFNISAVQNDSTNESHIDCSAIHIDHYQNIVVGFTRQEFELKRNGRSFEIQFKKTETIDRIVQSYSEVRDGDVLCRFNSTGHLEICVRNGKAAGLLGIRIGSPNNEIKIVFK